MAQRRLVDIAVGPTPGVSVGGVGRAAPLTRWTAAVALGGQGRYAAAATLLDDLVRDRRTPAALRAHALVTRASHLRQRGFHRRAEGVDGAALALLGGATGSPAGGAVGWPAEGAVGSPAAGGAAGSPIPDAWLDGSPAATGPVSRPSSSGLRGGGPSDAGARAAECGGAGPEERLCADAFSARIDALTGLAADALGQGHLPRAAALLARATALTSEDAEPRAGWRPVVRLRWVRAELALAHGDLAAAATEAGAAVRESVAAGSLRHELKSRLLAGVVAALHASQAGRAADTALPTLAEALAELDALAERAAEHDLLPLAWAAHLAADLTPDAVDDGAAAADDPALPPAAAEPTPRSVAAEGARTSPEHPVGAAPDTATDRGPDGPAVARPGAVGQPPPAPPSDGVGRPSDRPFGESRLHDRTSERVRSAVSGATNDAARRRHAVKVTLSVIRARSEGPR